MTTLVREWGRIGCLGFGGPPTHIKMLRELCVERERWIDASEFEDANAVCNLLPGPASTQLAIFCAWRLRGRSGALAGGAAFIVPGLIVLLALSVLFLSGAPPLWVLGAGAGAGAAVPAVAVNAGWSLVSASWQRRRSVVRWSLYLAAGLTAAATIGVWLVLVLLGCGIAELAVHSLFGDSTTPRSKPGATDPPGGEPAARGGGYGAPGAPPRGPGGGPAAPGGEPGAPSGGPDAPTASGGRSGAGGAPGGQGADRLRSVVAAPALLAVGVAVTGGVLASVAWEAVKIGGLAFGGGFVIIPLMQTDAVSHHHWMTGAQFLNAVALGQITPGPVVQTVAAVGYAAAGIGGGVLASVVAFAPSFAFVLLGGSHFHSIRDNQHARAFLDGAGPAAIGAILGSAITLARALTHPWQYAVLAAALILLLPLRRVVVLTLLATGAVGIAIALGAGTVAP